ncbi:MAG TPA: hypothetical protein DIU07_14780 [Rhodobacteraceae bacterium]|nr:hypothetical protein [Paracoccaceae bacterium]
MALSASFAAHLATGTTTVARCWALTRADGQVMGFTDHDADIVFTGVTFRADTGLTATALQQTTGLALDNSEGLGALSDLSVTEADIAAGRYDGAEVRAWLVNWADPSERVLQFRGRIGEVTRVAGAFRAELAGLSEALNTAQGSVYQTPCTAVLGDSACGVDLNDPAFSATGTVDAVEEQKLLTVSGLSAHDGNWYRRGRLTVTSGAAAGLVGVIKADSRVGGIHTVELWESLRAEIAPGDTVRLDAGCNKRRSTCRDKFSNILNFRGFPDIPGDNKLLTIPLRSTSTTSGTGAK